MKHSGLLTYLFTTGPGLSAKKFYLLLFHPHRVHCWQRTILELQKVESHWGRQSSSSWFFYVPLGYGASPWHVPCPRIKEADPLLCSNLAEFWGCIWLCFQIKFKPSVSTDSYVHLQNEYSDVEVGILGCNTMRTCKHIPTFRKNVVPLFSGLTSSTCDITAQEINICIDIFISGSLWESQVSYKDWTYYGLWIDVNEGWRILRPGVTNWKHKATDISWSCPFWCRVDLSVDTNVSEKYTASSMSLRNVGNYRQVYTAPKPRTPSFLLP